MIDKARMNLESVTVMELKKDMAEIISGVRKAYRGKAAKS